MLIPIRTSTQHLIVLIPSAVGIVFGSLLNMPAQAQSTDVIPNGVSYYPEKPTVFRKNAIALEKLGKCLQANAKSEASRYVVDGDKAPPPKNELTPIPRRTVNMCMPAFGRIQKISGEWPMVHYLVAGAIADAWVDEFDFSTFNIDQSKIDLGYSGSSQLLYKALVGFGDCVVRNATAQVGFMLKASAGSPEEKKSLESLSPVITKCNTTVGFKGDFAMFRPALALATYRHALANKDTPVGEQ